MKVFPVPERPIACHPTLYVTSLAVDVDRAIVAFQAGPSDLGADHTKNVLLCRGWAEDPIESISNHHGLVQPSEAIRVLRRARVILSVGGISHRDCLGC